MKKNEIEIGGQYTCKVTDKIVIVKITGENLHGGWDAINLKTNKKVHIKSAQRLRSAKFVDTKALVEQPKTRTKSHKRDDRSGLLPHEQAGQPVAQPAAPAGEAPAESSGTTTAAAGGDVGAPVGPGGKRLGILSAAIRVLEEHDGPEPLNCQQMFERMTAKGYWAPKRGGLTPAATLYSAILMEIRKKGEASRFQKVARGRFALNR